VLSFSVETLPVGLAFLFVTIVSFLALLLISLIGLDALSLMALGTLLVSLCHLVILILWGS
jgi:hypothetical protein